MAYKRVIMAYKVCKCGSTHFTCDVIGGYQDIVINNSGDVIDCDTTVTEIGPLFCEECGASAKEKKRRIK